ncbi:MAG: hypothetical protein WDM76_03115 [Limisphaerales bacterium]
MRLIFLFILWFSGFASPAGELLISLPEHATNAPTGSEFIQRITSADFSERERQIYSEIVAGNVPNFLRRFQLVTVTNINAGQTNFATFFVAPDYLAVGTDDDYFLVQMTPMTAQRIADRLGCTLPTRKMVDEIYAAAEVKLAPMPIPPSPAMTTVPVFAQHNEMVRAARAEFLKMHPLGALVAGHQKDLVITPMLTDVHGKVAIYGLQRTNGVPIQPLYLRHSVNWVDYSQCVRLVRSEMIVNGKPTTVAEVLANPNLAGLLNDEGVILNPRYPTNQLPALPAQIIATNSENEFKRSGQFGEVICSFTFAPEVKILINSPVTNFANNPVTLILYTLPNGNTIEQTIGHKLQPGDDWHFDIQHIGAQTRFLRAMLTNRTIVIAYLEAGTKSWPAWRKKYGDDDVPKIVERVKNFFPTNHLEIVLASHSGGGSFIFGYLNTIGKIPNNVTRIAFLDSNYAYNSALGHDDMLLQWLKSSAQHSLCVLAYDDASALLNGKPFVSADGGTWGRSHAMLKDFSAEFNFTSRTNNGLETYSALDGRLQFLLKENPDRKILHTVQVERNGFIHAMVLGTTNENRGYEYFGERAYTNWISN